MSLTSLIRGIRRLPPGANIATLRCTSPGADALGGVTSARHGGERIRSRKEVRGKAGDTVTVITGDPRVIDLKNAHKIVSGHVRHASPLRYLITIYPILSALAYRNLGKRPEKNLSPAADLLRPRSSIRLDCGAIKDLDEKPCPNRSKDCTDGRATPSRPWVSGIHPRTPLRPGQPPSCRPRPRQDFARREARVPSASSKADQTAPQPY